MKPLWAVTAIFFAACAAPAVPVEPGAEYSALRYSDTGLTSVNEVCPATGQPLNAEIEPLYVNGRPIGFC